MSASLSLSLAFPLSSPDPPCLCGFMSLCLLPSSQITHAQQGNVESRIAIWDGDRGSTRNSDTSCDAQAQETDSGLRFSPSCLHDASGVLSALRLLGPASGFLLTSICLNYSEDPFSQSSRFDAQINFCSRLLMSCRSCARVPRDSGKCDPPLHLIRWDQPD